MIETIKLCRKSNKVSTVLLEVLYNLTKFFMFSKNINKPSFILIAVAVFLLDQGSKFLAKKYILANTTYSIIPNIIELFLVENKGISYGFFANLSGALRILLVNILPLLIIFVIICYIFLNWQKIQKNPRIGWALILGGGSGNLLDRIFLGGVTDFMHFRFFEISFFVNNLADDFITIGFIFLIAKGCILLEEQL